MAGDTLSGISRRTGVGVEALKQANNLPNGLIRIGQELRIPAGGQVPQAAATTQVVQAPTPEPAAAPPAASADGGQQQAANEPPAAATEELTTGSIAPQEPAPAESGPSGLRWPARGQVIEGFGQVSAGKTNDGIDIAVPEGTPIRAAENGVVIYAGDGLRESRQPRLIRHERRPPPSSTIASLNVARGYCATRPENTLQRPNHWFAETSPPTSRCEGLDTSRSDTFWIDCSGKKEKERSVLFQSGSFHARPQKDGPLHFRYRGNEARQKLRQKKSKARGLGN